MKMLKCMQKFWRIVDLEWVGRFSNDGLKWFVSLRSRKSLDRSILIKKKLTGRAMSLHLGQYGQTIQRILWFVGLTRRLFTLSHLFEMVKNPFVVLVSEFTQRTQPYVSNSSEVSHTLRGQGIEWCGERCVWNGSRLAKRRGALGAEIRRCFSEHSV